MLVRNLSNSEVKINIPVPEKRINFPVSVRSSIEIDCIVFDNNIYSLNLKKKQFITPH